jgi:hypothetical protein
MKRLIRSTIALMLATAIIVAVIFLKAMPSHAASAIHLIGSQNYAGYANRSHATSVSASWQVPSVKCSNSHQGLAVWIGIGGLANDNDLEQDGILIVCNRSLLPQYMAVFEILPAAAQTLSFPVHPGDHIDASVTFVGMGTFNFQIHDTTQNWNFAQQGHKSGAHLASADCIVEAPSTLSRHILPLAKFSTVHISGCTANGKPISAGSSLTEIIMISPSASHVKAQPSELSGGTAFSVTWEHS